MQNLSPKTHTMGNRSMDTDRGKQNTMTRQGVKGTQRLNTQTLLNRRGTGEDREEGGGQVRGGAQRRKPGGNKTDRGRQREDCRKMYRENLGTWGMKIQT